MALRGQATTNSAPGNSTRRRLPNVSGYPGCREARIGHNRMKFWVAMSATMTDSTPLALLGLVRGVKARGSGAERGRMFSAPKV